VFRYFSLFNDTFSEFRPIQITGNDNSVSTLQEAAIICFTVLLEHYHGDADENHGKPPIL
jgi:hypothetical protein